MRSARRSTSDDGGIRWKTQKRDVLMAAFQPCKVINNTISTENDVSTDYVYIIVSDRYFAFYFDIDIGIKSIAIYRLQGYRWQP
jgi:hypothetical protein